MEQQLTIKYAWVVYGLDSANALQKRIKYAKSVGNLPGDTPHGVNAIFTDETANALGLSKVKPPNSEQPEPPSDKPEPPPPPPPRNPDKPKKTPKRKLNTKVKTPTRAAELQATLSHNWLVLLVLFSLILADGVAFSVIAQKAIDSIQYVGLIFFYIGIICGVGIMVMYAKVKSFMLAEVFKYIYGLLQFVVFEVAIKAKFWSWETCMTFMIVFIGMGVMYTIRPNN